MNNETEVYDSTSINPLTVLVGILIGVLAAAVTAWVLVQQSRKDTRWQIRNKTRQLRDQAVEFVGDSISQVRSIKDSIAQDGLEKLEEIKQHGQDLATDQLDHLVTAVKASKKAIQNA